MRSPVFIFPAVLCAAAFANDYYVSPGGNDNGPGSQARPWQTLSRLNAADLQAGDRALLEGGATFSGTLRLTAADSGAANSKIVITPYGSGRATVDGGTGSAIVSEGSAHLAIRNLVLRGAGRKTGNTASGLVLKNVTDVELDGIEVLGFRSSGVFLDGVSAARVTHVRAHQNGFAGISSGGTRSKDLYIAYCVTENNPGDPTVRGNHSGNGIVIGYADNVMIEYCESRYNGWDMPWTGNGPVGIWAYEADKVIIQYCVSHHNRSTATDGGGFDFDGGMTNSILQYNYSHDNFGAGYLVCQYPDASRSADNIVRYNISQDDGLFIHNSGIYVWVGGENMKSATVYNNTIFNSKGSGVVLDVEQKFAGRVPDLRFYNNIFVTQGPQIKGGAEKAKFAGNLYWSVGERGFNVDGYKDFASWARATGQEQTGGKTVGVFADPLLRKDGNGLLTDPATLSTLTEYQLAPGSPAIDAGVNLRAIGLDPGTRDFYGTALPSGAGFDIGAHEFRGAAVPRAPERTE